MACRCRRCSPPAACRDEEEEEEEEDDDKGDLLDRSALLPQAQAGHRKKRWYQWEDRELLTAWAG